MATIYEALAVAMHYHQSGNLQQAEAIYRQILQVDPRNGDALHFLGVIAGQMGKHGLAVEYISQAIRLRPSDAFLYYNLGKALQDQGKLVEAVVQYQEAIRFKTDYAEAHYNLGKALGEQGQLAEAVAQYQEALRFKPDSAEAHYNLGNALQEQGQLAAAVAQYQEAFRFKPDYAEAHNNLGIALQEQGQLAAAVAQYQEALRLKPNYANAHYNLGNALKDQGKLVEAAPQYQEALRLRPDFIDARFNLGNALREQSQLAAAVVQYQAALRLKPDFAEAHLHLGAVLQEQGQLAAAVAQYQEAASLKPDYADAYNNLGLALREQGQLTAAVAQYQEAVSLNPDFAEAHFGRALIWLLTGDFTQGWPEYEWRWQTKHMRGFRPSFSQPLWDGSSLRGKTILLWAEQGLGDTLQFVRYASRVKNSGGSVIVECQPVLVSLLQSCVGVDRVLARGSCLPPFDVHAPLVSLPRILDTTLTTIPAHVPYLAANVSLVEHWRQMVCLREQNFRIGIVWQCKNVFPEDYRRSVHLAAFAPLAALPGVHLFSLQKDSRSALTASASFSVTDLGGRLQTFADTAAALKNLDLLVTIDTAVAHCAGALGVPVWVALPYAPDWRWLLEREDSPWYPTMRLFRQKHLGDWDEVFARITKEVKKLLPLQSNQAL